MTAGGRPADTAKTPPVEKPDTSLERAITPADTNPWLTAVDGYREVAKWLVAAFGAIGAVIAGTVPLSDISVAHTGRLGFVIAGSATAILGVTIVLTAVVAALIPRSVRRHQLRSRRHGWFRRTFVGLSNFETLLAEHPEDVLPPGVTTLDELDKTIANLRHAAGSTAVSASALQADDPAHATYERAIHALNVSLSSYRLALHRALGIARYEKARSRFNTTLAAVMLGGTATAAGLGLTLFGLGHSPSSIEAVEPTGMDPVPVVASLTPEGVATLAARLGPNCDTSEIAALLLAGDRSSGPWDVVILPQAACNVVRVTLTPELGTVG